MMIYELSTSDKNILLEITFTNKKEEPYIPPDLLLMTRN